MTIEKKDKCYCLEIFRQKYGNHVTGNCLKLECERYRRENNLPPSKDQRKKNEGNS
ncbi:hypothetical protein AWH56_020710 [Anaerobacillus isosaccharinicus]|uniref:Uncharacterized protein n=1 Tax=Anaerobacillus isosaccharinicus TaxID=1532552 RepID=A0A7S7L644_9BACI|nr:hypothetical protein [Anaerobacillus isosaccharinicus]MBA5586671.1 hypothetical protein [Anaerobacillus isosaccharinicus]QOY35098.1 hypothetical protein AWH56_020710 [Anaerobacillus isosaccharinicus]